MGVFSTPASLLGYLVKLTSLSIKNSQKPTTLSLRPLDWDGKIRFKIFLVNRELKIKMN